MRRKKKEVKRQFKGMHARYYRMSNNDKAAGGIGGRL